MKNTVSIVLFLALAACQGSSINPEGNGNTPACGVANPVQDLPWLKAIVESSAGKKTDFCSLWSIVQGRYQGQTVYFATLTGQLCCTCGSPEVFDCQGERLFLCDPKKEAKIKDRRVVWQRN